MKIKYSLPEGLELQRNGAMIDLCASKDYILRQGEIELIDLGLSMELPEHIMAIVPPRSGLYKTTGAIVVNSIGIIDPPITNRTNIYCPDLDKLNGYVGNGDKWKANLYKLDLGVKTISKGDRLVQFHLMPTMDCPWWIYLKWIFKRKIEFVRVDFLSSNNNREGFNSTGLK